MNQKHLRFIQKHLLGEFCAQLRDDGFRVFILESATDSTSFFTEAKHALPLDPTISGNVHWDAFSDSLWGGLDACQSSKIALVVRNASIFGYNDKPGFDLALECMIDAAKAVEEEKRLEGKADAEIVVFLDSI